MTDKPANLHCKHGIRPSWTCDMCWHPDPEFGVYGLAHDTNRPVWKPDLLVDSGESNTAASIRAAPEGGNRDIGQEILDSIRDLKAYEKQVGGDHYAKLKIQPAEYAMANGLNYLQANAIKYITRYKDKNGEQDIDKAIHCLQLLKEYEYGSRTVQGEDTGS